MTKATSKASVVVLDLGTLSKGMPALTPALGTMHAESAAICLDERKHAPGVRLDVNGSKSPNYLLHWPKVTKQMKSAYADRDEATDRGACGVAILLVKELTGFKVIERAVKKTGFDYWVGAKQNASQPLKGMERLEVSGIRSGTDAQVKARVSQKKEQTKQSDKLKIAARIVVVEFGAPQATVVKR